MSKSINQLEQELHILDEARIQCEIAIWRKRQEILEERAAARLNHRQACASLQDLTNNPNRQTTGFQANSQLSQAANKPHQKQMSSRANLNTTVPVHNLANVTTPQASSIQPSPMQGCNKKLLVQVSAPTEASTRHDNHVLDQQPTSTFPSTDIDDGQNADVNAQFRRYDIGPSPQSRPSSKSNFIPDDLVVKESASPLSHPKNLYPAGRTSSQSRGGTGQSTLAPLLQRLSSVDPLPQNVQQGNTTKPVDPSQTPLQAPVASVFQINARENILQQDRQPQDGSRAYGEDAERGSKTSIHQLMKAYDFMFPIAGQGDGPQQDFSTINDTDRLLPRTQAPAYYGKGLTRKQQRHKRASSPSLNDGKSPQLKRSLSIELMEARPGQRPRPEDGEVRIPTPPLNDDSKLRVLPITTRAGPDAELLNSDPIEDDPLPVEYGHTEQPGRAQRPQPPSRRPANIDKEEEEQEGHDPAASTLHGGAGPTRPPPTQGISASVLRRKQPDTSGSPNSPSRGRRSPNPSASRHRRQLSGTPAVINSSNVDINSPRPIRPGAQKQPGSYKVSEYRHLTTSQRHDLEMRFCAKIAMIVGSKYCVSMSPMPYDSMPIFERLKERLLNVGENGYRTHQDFHTDAKHLLANYAKLGACPECPFANTGNARVMCYRMRLTAIIDARMRELKRCLDACAYDNDAQDMGGKIKTLDEWFSEEDFQRDGHAQDR